MALSDILEKIKAEVEKKAQELETEHEKEMNKIKSDFADKKAHKKDEVAKKVETHCENIIQKAENLAEMEAKNALLKAKHKLINQAFADAVKELASHKDYENILVSLLKETNIGEDVEVIAAKGKEAVTKAAIEKSGKRFKLSNESADIMGGFIARSSNMEIDNSLESIIEDQLRDKLEIGVSKLLFS